MWRRLLRDIFFLIIVCNTMTFLLFFILCENINFFEIELLDFILSQIFFTMTLMHKILINESNSIIIVRYKLFFCYLFKI